MPRYERYANLRSQIGTSIKRPSVLATWSDDGANVYFDQEGKLVKYELKSGKMSDATARPTSGGGATRQNRRGPERGRQFDVVYTPDGNLKAFHRGGNVFISDKDGAGEYAVTAHGRPPLAHRAPTGHNPLQRLGELACPAGFEPTTSSSGR